VSKLRELAKFGQAAWLDCIGRSFMISGDMQAPLDHGRRVIRFSLGSDVVGGPKRVAGMP